ncbi:protein translocase subunit SecD [Bacteroidetes/Chlorobi group bacterium ChocPot_Mid]|nr:MAG: protein translocase subunit SecD [Bacteroidetes/Chlorobi group bacterium ChocPot_Mid]
MKKHIGKILIIVIPIIAAIAMLYPTYRAYDLNKIKTQVEKLAEQDSTSADSLARIERFEKQYGKDLESANNNRVKLGLDLRGGMYVTLEVDVVRLIDESAQKETKDEIFEQVIAETRQESQNNNDPVIDIFLKKFNKIARPKGKSLLSYFDIGDIRDASEEKIIERLKKNEESAIDQALEVIRQRIDKYGVSEPTIQKQGSRRIMLELPGVNKENEMRKLLQTTARLEFNLVKNDQKIVRAFYKIDKLLAEQAKRRKGILDTNSTSLTSDTASAIKDTTKNIAAKNDTTSSDTTTAKKADTSNPYAGLSEKEAQRRYLEDHPFTTLFLTFYLSPGERSQSMPVNYTADAFPSEGEYNFMIYEPMLKKFNEILSRPEVRSLIPSDLKILREAKPDERILKQSNVNAYNFFALKAEPELTGDVITNAVATFDPQTNQPMVTMGMNTDGAERWARITGANIKKRIAIVLDDQVYSAPVVQVKITGGNSQITGMANADEAHLLEIVLKAGALKAPVQIIEERVVGPSLGEDSIRSGITALVIATILVILFMILYYRKGGIIADFAVILNIILIIAVLAAFQGTLTLPGIAGLILTLGMAVDANILIFERIREELFKGRSLRSAIDEGFSKAYSAIIDSNITTGITAVILYFLGTGPIQGFALTLLIGIFGTLFTGIMVSRAIIELLIAKGATSFNFGQPKVIQS